MILLFWYGGGSAVVFVSTFGDADETTIMDITGISGMLNVAGSVKLDVESSVGALDTTPGQGLDV